MPPGLTCQWMNRERTQVAAAQSIASAQSQRFSCRGNSAFPAAPFQQQARGELALGAATGQKRPVIMLGSNVYSSAKAVAARVTSLLFSESSKEDPIA